MPEVPPSAPIPVRLLMIIRGDPRLHPRAAEALRIAAGVSAWERVSVSVFLEATAAGLLGESGEAGGTEDAAVARHCRMLREKGCPIYVPAGSLPAGAGAGWGGREVSEGELAALAAGSRYVLRFGP